MRFLPPKKRNHMAPPRSESTKKDQGKKRKQIFHSFDLIKDVQLTQ